MNDCINLQTHNFHCAAGSLCTAGWLISVDLGEINIDQLLNKVCVLACALEHNCYELHFWLLLCYSLAEWSVDPCSLWGGLRTFVTGWCVCVLVRNHQVFCLQNYLTNTLHYVLYTVRVNSFVSLFLIEQTAYCLILVKYYCTFFCTIHYSFFISHTFN